MVLLLACSNTIRAVGGAPFELEQMESATITQTADSDPEAGAGFADLLISSLDLQCGEDPGLWEGSTVELRLRWVHEVFDPEDDASDQGWEGTYTQAASHSVLLEEGVGAVQRSFFTTVHADGERWDLDLFPGTAEIQTFGGQVTGVVDHQWVRGRFTAQRCRQLSIEDTGA